MRRTAVLFTVLALASLVSVNQASAHGWLGPWRGTRYQTRQCRSVATAPDQVRVAMKTAERTATAPSKTTIPSNPVVSANESAVPGGLIDVIKGVLKVENERLDRVLEWHEEAEETEYGED